MESAVIFPMARKQQKDPFLFFVVLLVLFLLFGLPLLKDQSSFRQIFTSDPAVQTSSSKTVKSESKSVSQTPSKKMTKESDHQRPPEEREAKFTDAVMVQKVIDGDTIELADGRHVRLIGIDTPETVDPRRPVGCFGREASDKNKELVEGKNVRLVKDISETDKYGRLLRYVYVGDIFVNEYLVREGYARASSYPPDVRYRDLFREAEADARINKRGLWADGACEDIHR
jgi:endonuclease YncB( thermonuclease family)